MCHFFHCFPFALLENIDSLHSCLLSPDVISGYFSTQQLGSYDQCIGFAIKINGSLLWMLESLVNGVVSDAVGWESKLDCCVWVRCIPSHLGLEDAHVPHPWSPVAASFRWSKNVKTPVKQPKFRMLFHFYNFPPGFHFTLSTSSTSAMFFLFLFRAHLYWVLLRHSTWFS